jgi:hypothetical protein
VAVPALMAASRANSRAEAGSVFLNVPFDPRYQSLFVALIGGLTALGRKPHCVLEVPSTDHRLKRISELMARCQASVHDLSYGGLSGRPEYHGSTCLLRQASPVLYR